eukprot:scaffold25482_cov73-Phaeocystis_antarctica.AAC.2
MRASTPPDGADARRTTIRPAPFCRLRPKFGAAHRKAVNAKKSGLIEATTAPSERHLQDDPLPMRDVVGDEIVCAAVRVHICSSPRYVY